jgi:hypothetical protein
VRVACTVTWPCVPVTDVDVPVPPDVHAPPVSAVPQPLATVRLNASAATVLPGAVTVTVRVVEPVSPSSSVTVRPTVYVPAAA